MSFPFLLLFSYLIGAIPTGVILTRLAGTADIRKSGSGNIGATNVYRVAGRKLGVLTLIGDAVKGAVPVLFAAQSGFTPEQVAMVGGAAFLGHLYPVYLGFKGGKGVATALGILLVISPWSVLGALVVFVLALWIWRYISLGSVSAAAVAPLLVFAVERSTPFFLTTLFIGAMVIVRHRSNIERLLNGTESRFRA